MEFKQSWEEPGELELIEDPDYYPFWFSRRVTLAGVTTPRIIESFDLGLSSWTLLSKLLVQYDDGGVPLDGLNPTFRIINASKGDTLLMQEPIPFGLLSTPAQGNQWFEAKRIDWPFQPKEAFQIEITNFAAAGFAFPTFIELLFILERYPVEPQIK